MPGAKRVASEEETLAPRINSGHLSDQFQRELSSNGDDLLQAELTIDDINSASGASCCEPCISPTCTQPLQLVRLLHRQRSFALFESQHHTVELTLKT